MHRNRYPDFSILIVDDEEMGVLNIRNSLSSAGLNNILECCDSTRVMDILEDQEVGVILLDISMPNISGLELLKSIQFEHPQITEQLLILSQGPVLPIIEKPQQLQL